MIDWKYAAREKLRDYEAQQNAIETIPEELDLLRSRAESIKSMDTDSERVTGGESTREDMLLSNIQKRGELERMLVRARSQVELTDRALDTLNDDDRRILEIMYIHPEKGKVARAMMEFGLRETKSVYYRLGKAMERFTISYYGCTES